MIRILVSALLFLLFSPCDAHCTDEKPLPVIVSIAPQKYLLQRIAGKYVSVSVLVKPGMDPHSYEPSPSQMRQCADSRAWFTIGVPFEDIWLERIKSAAPGMNVISSITGITRLPYDSMRLEDALPQKHARGSHEYRQENHEHGHDDSRHSHSDSGHGHEHGHGHGDSAHGHDDSGHSHGHGHGHSDSAHGHGPEDPHVWLSPVLVRKMLPGMAEELGKLLPAHAERFRDNARAFSTELETLDRALRERFEKIPRENRVFLTFHPSWRYYAHDYGLRELSIEADGKEPGPKSMKAIIDLAKELRLKVIFIEPQFSGNAAAAIAASLDAGVMEADPLAEDLPALYKKMANNLLETFPE